MAGGSSRTEANIPRPNNIAHRPGSIHRLSGCACLTITTISNPPAPMQGRNWVTAKYVLCLLQDRSRPPHRPDHDAAHDEHAHQRRRDPHRQDIADVLHRIGQQPAPGTPPSLPPGRRKTPPAAPIATEFLRLGHFLANLGNLAKSVAKFHNPPSPGQVLRARDQTSLTLYCKA